MLLLSEWRRFLAHEHLNVQTVLPQQSLANIACVAASGSFSPTSFSLLLSLNNLTEYSLSTFSLKCDEIKLA
jgi:hypothetical protein